MKKKTEEAVSVKEIASQILNATYSTADDPRDALCEAGIRPSGAAMMLMSVLRKAVNNSDATCAKFMREAAGEAEQEMTTRPLSGYTDAELEAWL